MKSDFLSTDNDEYESSHAFTSTDVPEREYVVKGWPNEVRLQGDMNACESIVKLYENVSKITKMQSNYTEWRPATFIQDPPAWQTQLKNVATVGDIIFLIKYFGRLSVAKRLHYLHSIPIDESYENPMSLESVKGFALFIVDNMYLPYPDITVNPEGHVMIEWGMVGHDKLILEFLSSKHVEYLHVLQQSESAQQRRYSSGVTDIDDIADIINPAIHNMMLQ